MLQIDSDPYGLVHCVCDLDVGHGLRPPEFQLQVQEVLDEVTNRYRTNEV